MPGSFSIGELAKATGTKAETVRYYERIGLLPEPARTSGNYRAYSRPHLERLSFIRRARDLGFSLDQVRALLRLADDREQSCAEVDRIAKLHLTEVDRKIATSFPSAASCGSSSTNAATAQLQNAASSKRWGRRSPEFPQGLPLRNRALEGLRRRPVGVARRGGAE